MQRIEPVVWKETKYIALWVLVFSVLMQGVFLVIGAWDITVLFGNLLTGVAVILNFFAMAVTIQHAVQKEPKEAKQTMNTSKALRMLGLAVVVILGVSFPAAFALWAVLPPLLFPRLAIALRPLCKKEGRKEDADPHES